MAIDIPYKLFICAANYKAIAICFFTKCIFYSDYSSICFEFKYIKAFSLSLSLSHSLTCLLLSHFNTQISQIRNEFFISVNNPEKNDTHTKIKNLKSNKRNPAHRINVGFLNNNINNNNNTICQFICRLFVCVCVCVCELKTETSLLLFQVLMLLLLLINIHKKSTAP